MFEFDVRGAWELFSFHVLLVLRVFISSAYPEYALTVVFGNTHMFSYIYNISLSTFCEFDRSKKTFKENIMLHEISKLTAPVRPPSRFKLSNSIRA